MQAYDVPIAPGVPNVLRTAEAIAAVAIRMPDSPFFLGQRELWGIYLLGRLLVQADSVLNVDYTNSCNLSQFPVQRGAFANYNKVNNPFEAVVTLTKGGSAQQRADFINAVDAAANSIALYDVVTPERVYVNANIEGYNYHRTNDNGAHLYIVEIRLLEIRQVALAYGQTSQQTSNAQNPASIPPVNSGQVQAQAPVNDSLLKGIFN